MRGGAISQQASSLHRLALARCLLGYFVERAETLEVNDRGFRLLGGGLSAFRSSEFWYVQHSCSDLKIKRSFYSGDEKKGCLLKLPGKSGIDIVIPCDSLPALATACPSAANGLKK